MNLSLLTRNFMHRIYGGSIAHVKMLGKQNIISTDEMNQIIKGLESIRKI